MVQTSYIAARHIEGGNDNKHLYLYAGVNSRQSWCLMHMSTGGSGFIVYLLRQPKHLLMFPAILHNVNGEHDQLENDGSEGVKTGCPVKNVAVSKCQMTKVADLHYVVPLVVHMAT